MLREVITTLQSTNPNKSIIISQESDDIVKIASQQKHGPSGVITTITMSPDDAGNLGVALMLQYHDLHHIPTNMSIRRNGEYIELLHIEPNGDTTVMMNMLPENLRALGLMFVAATMDTCVAKE